MNGMSEHTTEQQPTLWPWVISQTWTRRRPREPHIPDFRSAVHQIRSLTGMTLDQLAIHCGVLQHQIHLWEMRGGKFTTENAKRLEIVALDFGLLRVAEFLRMEGLKKMYSRKTKQSELR